MSREQASEIAILQALAHTDRLSDLLPLLHRQAVEAVGGTSSILFQFDPAGEWLQATSAFGVDRLPSEPWLATGGLVPHALFRDGKPIAAADLAKSVRGISECLGAPAAVLVPLAHLDERLGVLAIGCASPPAAARLAAVAPVGDAFALALDRDRVARDSQLQRDLRVILHEFSRTVSTSLNLATGFEALCASSNHLFAADRASVWMHDRVARTMILTASTDPMYVAERCEVSTEDALAPAAIALRHERAEITTAAPGQRGTGTITIPLKGRRRALGTFILEGARIEAGTELEVLERADELGRQLSAAIENVFLLDQVLRTRRETDAQVEAERAELRTKLMQSEKLAALGQFVAGIAHELNNPLQGVLGHLELLRTTGAFPKAIRRDVQRIYREADRAAKIVRNLLVFAGSRRMVRKRVSLNAVMTRIFALRAPALKAENIEVVRERGENLPRVIGDPLLLHQAFLNIVLNAEQAIGSNGRIETRKRLLTDPPRVAVEIRDTGAGIAHDVLPHLFEPFYTTKEVGKGTGLGLAIAYGIVQEHGGTISASNHPEGGAVFTVTLPAENG